MPHDIAARLRAGPGLFANLPDSWRPALGLLAGAWIANFLLFLSDWADMANQWWNISTYNHVVLVPAIVAWLVHERLPQLARLTPQAWGPGLVVCAGAGMLWVLGEFAGLSVARQAGVVALLGGSVLTFLGPRIGAVLAFPLAYTIFLVPIGDELIPALQMITAAITIGLVHLSGVAATIDGVFIHTPAGLFEVAEACSGVKFLIAMAAFGVLAAEVCFARWPRRLAFLAVCLVVPVLANGVRAWATVFAAQYVGAERASGFDHIVYGWIFFALVIALVLALSWRFFDRPIHQPMVDLDRIAASRLIARLETLRIGTKPAVAGLVAILLVAQVWARAADALAAPMPEAIALPQVAGWQPVAYRPSLPWEPRAQGADHRLMGRYADAAGDEVDVFFALYAAQGEGREAGGFGQGALPPSGLWAWQSPGPAVPDARTDRILAEGHVERLAYTWYRTGDLLTGSNARLKLANMGDRLILRERPTMMLIVSAEDRPGRPAKIAIDRFLRAIGPADRWMDRMAGLR
ncbi:exosortase A [Novosphingobium sp. JCM 18896]|uniref:exosortase A n=1 Tax=Novosphingobium sp. JCM 18896 TaxID=2989731 RepID=UPI002222F786|nr:exosortase A [Novosphingobium sp. JCM 18896]MCW1428155.1 exosortase A [Novosphingobium sp. JCM 18896]